MTRNTEQIYENNCSDRAKIMTMNKDKTINSQQFRQYLKRGHGRCFAVLKSTADVEKYRKDVLWGCLNGFAFDDSYKNLWIFYYIFYYFSRGSMIEQLNLHLFLVFVPIIRYNTYI